MAATPISAIVTAVRNQLIEPTARFWQDAELQEIMRLGAIDLWGAILDLHQDHYFKVNATDVVLKSGLSEVSGVPDDCFRILLIEPRTTTANSTGNRIIFVPRKYKDTDFAVARTLDAQDPSTMGGRTIYYDITGVGSPVEAPHIQTAPIISSDLPLRLVYNPTLAWDASGVNPVPGASDNALKAWTVAFAMAKEGPQGGRIPDPGWLKVYATEKQTILTRLTPREEQEPEVVEDLFQGFGGIWG